MSVIDVQFVSFTVTELHWCAAGAASRHTGSKYCPCRVAAHCSADFVVSLHGPFVGEVCLNAVRYLFLCLLLTSHPERRKKTWK